MRRNRTERQTWGAHDRVPHQRLKTSDQKLDEALAQTFPASDPPAQTQPVIRVGRSKPSQHPR